MRSCRMIGGRKRKEVQVMGGGIGGGFVGTLCRLDSLQIGPFGWTEPVATLALHTSGGIGSQDISLKGVTVGGLLTLGKLTRYA